MHQFVYQSAIELAELIRTGQATSTQVVTEHLNQIKKYNSQLNALVSIFEEEALHEAALCDQEADEGKFRGPLHGVPITIKEAFWIKGQKSTMNFKMMKNFVAPEDAVVVERIKRSGAVIIGKTNVPKNLLDFQVNGDIFPEGKNPFNTDYSPGGSTGGGAVALTAGFTPLELGSDFGGSVRVPANFCGLYSLKPTEKTVPLHGNSPLPKNNRTFIHHMMQAGPLARNLDDLELLWKIIVGPHESDRNIPDINWQPPSGKTINQYKIAWTDGWPGFEASSQVSEAMHKLAEKIAIAGGKIHKRIPDKTLHHKSLETFVGLFPYVIAQGMPWYIRKIIKMQLFRTLLKGMRKVDALLLAPLDKAFKMDANHYAEVLLQRSQMVMRWEQFFMEYDFLICPVAFGPAFKRCKIGTPIKYDGKEMIYANYVWPYVGCFNASGNPSLAIPLGLGKEGLPLGIQIVGKYWSEPELIHFAKQVAALTDGFVPPAGYQ